MALYQVALSKLTNDLAYKKKSAAWENLFANTMRKTTVDFKSFGTGINGVRDLN